MTPSLRFLVVLGLIAWVLAGCDLSAQKSTENSVFCVARQMSSICCADMGMISNRLYNCTWRDLSGETHNPAPDIYNPTDYWIEIDYDKRGAR